MNFHFSSSPGMRSSLDQSDHSRPAGSTQGRLSLQHEPLQRQSFTQGLQHKGLQPRLSKLMFPCLQGSPPFHTHCAKSWGNRGSSPALMETRTQLPRSVRPAGATATLGTRASSAPKGCPRGVEQPAGAQGQAAMRHSRVPAWQARRREGGPVGLWEQRPAPRPPGGKLRCVCEAPRGSPSVRRFTRSGRWGGPAGRGGWRGGKGRSGKGCRSRPRWRMQSGKTRTDTSPPRAWHPGPGVLHRSPRPERTETILLTPSMTVSGSWRLSVEHCRSNSTRRPSAPGR